MPEEGTNPMSKILTCAIHKGGSGKTTAAYHLARRAGERGWKTLLVDLDGQGNASQVAAGVGPGNRIDTPDNLRAAALFDVEEGIGKPILAADAQGLSLLPADLRLLEVERLPLEAINTFKMRLHAVANDFDVVVIDTPPTMGMAMLAPMFASHYAFAPVVPDGFGLAGAMSIAERVAEVRTAHNPELQFLGILVNRFSSRDADQKRVVASLEAELGDFLIPHKIPHSTAISALSHTRQPVWYRARSGSTRQVGKVVRAAMDWVLDAAAIAPAVAVAGAR